MSLLCFAARRSLASTCLRWCFQSGAVLAFAGCSSATGSDSEGDAGGGGLGMGAMAAGGHPTAMGGDGVGGVATGGVPTGGQSIGGQASGGVTTGGTAGAGGTSGGTGSGAVGAGGTGGASADPCAESEWTCVPVDASGPYGTHTIVVPAAQNWVNTGLFLKAGEMATVTVTGGTWSVEGAGNGIDHGPCLEGDLVARIGLHYKDPKLTCVNGTAVVTADKDGILFLGALAGNDLGESYESRRNDTGAKTTTVESQGDTVPTVQSADATTYSFDAVSSGWVEVWGEHVILTLPADIAAQDASTLAAATDRLDAIYDLHEQLRGAVPHNGQRLRFFPDGTNPGYMLAGNPIRMQFDLVEGDDSTRISRAGEPGTGNWGFAHEMGHDFTFIDGFWSYQQDSIEVWCNVFSMHAVEALGLPLHGSITSCNSSSSGSYIPGDGSWDPWTGLCFLMQFQYEYGWEFYEEFFRAINDDQNVPYVSDWETSGWHFVHDKFEVVAGEDVTPVFSTWNVPHP